MGGVVFHGEGEQLVGAIKPVSGLAKPVGVLRELEGGEGCLARRVPINGSAEARRMGGLRWEPEASSYSFDNNGADR